MAGEWVVATDHVWLDGLGPFLARAVSGEWKEAISSGLVAYVLEKTETGNEVLPIALAVSRYLLEERTATWLEGILHHQYRGLSDAARRSAVSSAVRYVHSDPKRDRERINFATTELLRFLAEHDVIVLNGVTTFLWPEITRELEAAVAWAVDDVHMETAYKEYLAVLRSLALPAKEALHVLWEGERFSVQNENGQPVAKDVLSAMWPGDEVDKAASEDALISLMVSLAPRQLTLHGRPRDRDGDHILSVVFGSRLAYCAGCPRCRHHGRIDEPLS